MIEWEKWNYMDFIKAAKFEWFLVHTFRTSYRCTCPSWSDGLSSKPRCPPAPGRGPSPPPPHSIRKQRQANLDRYIDEMGITVLYSLIWLCVQFYWYCTVLYCTIVTILYSFVYFDTIWFRVQKIKPDCILILNLE